MAFNGPDELRNGMRKARWRIEDLWLASIAVGGNFVQSEIELMTSGQLALTPYQYDVLAAALNEQFTEMGQNKPIPYWPLADPPL